MHHKRLAVGLKGKKNQRGIADLFSKSKEDSLVNMMELDLIIGSGGVLSHAPDRKSTALMLIDAYEPEGVTRLAVDSIFMMPHLGVFSNVHPEAAVEIFMKDCVVPLGHVISPVGRFKKGEEILRIESDKFEQKIIKGGELVRFNLAAEEEAELSLTPLKNSVDIGAGPGKASEQTLSGGDAGIVIDARGRPITFPQSELEATELQQVWQKSMGLTI